MKKILLKPKTFITMGALSLGLIFGISALNFNLSSRQMSLHKVNGGVGICFQRITQTFTALMIRDFGSEYLTKDFRSMTSDCVNEVTTALSTIGVGKSALKMTNNFKSDLHWFDQKLEKVNQMAIKDEVDLGQSNILSKYSELESLKSKLEDIVMSEASSAGSTRSYGIIALILGQLALILSFVAFYFHRKIARTTLNELETITENKVTEGTIDKNIMGITYQVFELIGAPKTRQALENFHTEMIRENQKLEDNIIKMNSFKYEKYVLSQENSSPGVDLFNINNVEEEELAIRETSDFNTSMNAVLDRVYDKAFSQSILLDTDLADEFRVFSSQENLEQLLYSLVTYSMDSALCVDKGRKVTIRSKSLGGIAYCKVKIGNYAFSEDELAILNGKKPSSETSVNLLVLRELIIDANASIGVKNKQNSSISSIESEIEIIFERSKDEQAVIPVENTASTKVVKGNKQQIREYFDQNM